MGDKSEKHFKSKLSEEKVRQALTLIEGLTYSQWVRLRVAIEYAYREKAAKNQLGGSDDSKVIESLLEL